MVFPFCSVKSGSHTHNGGVLVHRGRGSLIRLRKGQIAVLQQFFQFVLLLEMLALLLLHDQFVGVENLAVQGVPGLLGDGEKHR